MAIDPGTLRILGDTSFFNELVAENRFVMEDIMPRFRLRRFDVSKRGPILGQVHVELDGFVSKKDGSLLELAMPIIVKVRDSLLRV